MKKAVILSLASFMMVTLVFSLALVIYSTLPKSEEIFLDSIIMDKVYDLSSSVESGIREIFEEYFEASITLDENEDSYDVSFSEGLKRDKEDWGQEFAEKIDLFQRYVESKEPAVTIYSEILKDDELPIVIMPHDIEYTRNWEIGHAILGVHPNTAEDNFDSYDITVNTGNLEIDKVQEQFKAAGDFNLRVFALDNFGHNFIKEKAVDATDSHQIQIFLKGGNKIKVTLNNRDLEIWTNDPTEISVTTKIDGLEKTEEGISIAYADNSVYVDLSEFNLVKNSTLKIL